MKRTLGAVVILTFLLPRLSNAEQRSHSSRRATQPSPAPYRVVLGQQGHEELLGLVRLFAHNNIAWNLPGGLRQAFNHSNRLKVGDVFGPTLDNNRKGGIMFNFEDTPNGRIEKWTERGMGRSFFMYWIINPLGDRGGEAQGGPGTIAYLETSLPLPLRRHVIVIAEYRGLKTIQNIYGEVTSVPFLQVIAAATTNDYYYIDQDWTTVAADVEFHFDDRAILALKKGLKPLDDDAGATQPKPDLAALPGIGPKSTTAQPETPSKVCAALTKILASRDEIAARHGAEKTDRAIAAASVKFKENKCAK